MMLLLEFYDEIITQLQKRDYCTLVLMKKVV